jgi:dolichol-phosphate mannosyltransferase
MISIVVPAYNERGNMKALVERAGNALAASGEPYELIIVDDNSTDGTADEVRRLQDDRPWLRLVLRTDEHELSTAVMAGWDVARGDVLGCMDVNLRHPPEVLTKLVGTMRAFGADIVVASRHARGGGVGAWSLTERLACWTATLLATLAVPGILGAVRDPMSGFFLLHRDVIQRVPLKPRGYKLLLEVLARGNYKSVREIAYVFGGRADGGTKTWSYLIRDYITHLCRIPVETWEARRAAKFIAVGFSGGLVNLFFYRLLTATLGWPVWQAATSSAGIGVLNNFVWNERFTFAEVRKDSPRATSHRFLVFTLVSVVGLIMNAALVELLVAVLHWPWQPGVVAAIAVAGVWNFFANANVTWGSGRVRKRATDRVVLEEDASKRESPVGE